MWTEAIAGGNTADPMLALAGGDFVMGSDHHYPEEKPARVVRVASFALDRHAVTNAQFAAFVTGTGHVTTAERPGPDGGAPGSMVFRMTDGPVSLLDPSQWWVFVPGACWHAPEGPGSGISNRMDHPVVQVSHEDATAYAAWAGKRLLTEAEWEFAASLAFDADEVQASANIWRGAFPYRNDHRTDAPFTVPADAVFGRPGLPVNLIGNVWEWTSSSFDRQSTPGCCGGSPGRETEHTWALKGGSFLCAESYCRRYRPQARMGQTPESSTNHIGFRCAADWCAQDHA